MTRFWYFVIALSLVSFMLSTLTWISMPVSQEEHYIERFTKYDMEEEPQRNKLESYFFDLGRSESSLFITPTDQVIMVDTGNQDQYEKLLFMLNEMKITEIDYLFLTTAESDHIGAFPALIEDITVNYVIIPKTKIFEELDTTYKDGLLKANHVVKVTNNKKLQIEENLSIVSLYTEPLVMIVQFHDIKTLMMSDANFDVEESLVKTYGDQLHAPILKVGNHGQSLTNSEEFLKAVNPQVAVILGGDKEESGRPYHGVIERLTESWIDVYRNDVKGTILIVTDGKTYKVEEDYQAYSSSP